VILASLGGAAPPLSTSAIEDHLDVPVVAEPLQQILVQAGFMARDQEEMASHWLVYCLSTLCTAAHFFLARSNRQHSQCHS